MAGTLFSLVLHVIHNRIKTKELIAVAALVCACPPGSGGMGKVLSHARVRDRALWREQCGALQGSPAHRAGMQGGTWGSHST